MKKIFIFILLPYFVLDVSVNVKAQQFPEFNEKIISIHGGLTFSNQLGFPKYIAKFSNSPWFWRVFPWGGLSLNSRIKQKEWFVRTGINYSFKGSKYRVFRPGEEVYLGYLCLYLDVPIQIGRNLSNIGSSLFSNISFQAGPQISFRSWVTSTYATRDSVSGAYDVDRTIQNDEFKPIDIQFSAHLDLKFSKRVSVSFDYSQSIITNHKTSFGQNNNPLYDYRNIAFQIAINYKFLNLWKKIFSKKEAP
jgi:Outer membrane protein beta-barrel domain